VDQIVQVIEDKEFVKDYNLVELQKIKLGGHLTLLDCLLTRLMDLDGNLAFTKSSISTITVDDNVTMHARVYEIEGETIYFIPAKIMMHFIIVELSEEIYCRDEEEVQDELKRISQDSPDEIEQLQEMLKDQETYQDGSILIKAPPFYHTPNTTFYSLYWAQKKSCCGHICLGCRQYFFPEYSVNAIRTFKI